MSALRLAGRMLSAVMVVAAATTASSQEYPSKPIRILTSAAGGGSDFTSRQVAQGIAGPLGQPVVVDNRGGGMIAADVVYKAPPDGYTLTVQGAALWIVPLLTKAPYTVNDFVPVAQLDRTVYILAVHPSLPVKSVRELIALAKAHPGELNYSSVSTGGATHLATELFNTMANVKIVHVPYKGAAPASTALVSGEVQLMIFDIGVLMPHAKTGRVRALAVTSATPSALVPGLPTLSDSGLPGYEAIGMTGMFATAKTPQPIIDRLNREVARALSRPEVKERFLVAGLETVGSTQEQFIAAIKADAAKMAKVIKDANIKVD
jgi:tripartite-type tricarboxylate transporter receptor subunit TctC